jgi:hypothetical protein
MRHLLLAVLVLVSVASCAVETDDIGESDSPAPATTIVSMPQSIVAPSLAELQPIRTAACDQSWECRRCGVNSRQNVLVETCDDGSRRIVQLGPCGQPCF